MEPDFAGQTIFVTGASGGLGNRMAKILSERGAKVALAARRKDKLEALKMEIEQAGGLAVVVEFDVADVDSIDSAIAVAENELGPMTALINNAGINIRKYATEFTPENYDALFDVNLRAPFFLSTAFAKLWIGRGSAGRILNIASLAAYHMVPTLTPYAMSKMAMVHMTACLAREWAAKGIAVNGIAPGYLRTEINDFFWDTPDGQKTIASFPRQRVGDASDIDAAVLLMLDPAQRFITGQTLTIDDGQGLN